MSRDKQNLNPTAEARFAMRHWHDRYAAQHGGSMDFYLDVLTKQERQYCIDSVREIVAAWQTTPQQADWRLTK